MSLVQLDPTVELFESPQGGWNLICPAHDLAVVVPAQLIELLEILREPVEDQALFQEYDEESVRPVLDALRDRGLLYDSENTAEQAAKRLAAKARPVLRFPADQVASFDRPADLFLEHDCKSDATPLVELARARRHGDLHAHRISIDCKNGLPGDAALDAAFLLGARLLIDEQAALGSNGAEIDRLSDHLAAKTLIARAGADTAHWNRLAGWLQDVSWNGLILRFDRDRLPELDQIEAFDRRLFDLENKVTDLEVEGLAGEEVISGRARREHKYLDADPRWAALRKIDLKNRVEKMRAREDAKYFWAQVPEAEDAWVRSADDLIPNHPDLLGLAPGRVIADVCGGYGRVARRLAPFVGKSGTIISIDRDASVVDRARDMALEVPSIDLRRGDATRLPLPDNSVDGAILERAQSLVVHGVAKAITQELTRVVKPGGRIVVSYWLCRLPLEDLSKPIVHRPNLHAAIKSSLEVAGLELLDQRFWGSVEKKEGLPVTWFLDHQVPRLIDPGANKRFAATPPDLDLYVTAIARKQ